MHPNNHMHFILAIIAFALAGMILFSCKKTDKGEEEAVQIEAAMMEGREAARIFLNRTWNDTIELQQKLQEARSRRIKFDSLGLDRSAVAYDSGFVTTIRTVNPEIAKHIK